MEILIICLPLISAIGAGFFGWSLGHKGSAFFTIACLSFATIISIATFWEIFLESNGKLIPLGTWIDSGLLIVNWNFLFDSLSVTMLVVVCSISTLVHVYSVGYMGEDPHLSRFMAYLSLFTFFMIILVTSDNFLQLFVGWEGVGLCSYLLISFWFTRLQANKSAIKAILLNRIGDIGLTLGMVLIFYLCQSLDFAVVFSLMPLYIDEVFIIFGWEFNYITLICFFLFIGAVGKSAQLGLHVWLPDAMEGPTPVSALIHAATMVTAGIFLVIRCAPIFEYSPTMLSIIAVIGACTAFFAATAGVVQNDLKKVIAYSTCSQLGYMMFICGLSHYNVGFYHLVNHAFFKALLFLGAGVIIHALNDEQDMRKMGGLVRVLPLTYSLMVVGSLALMGFPFLSGYYSKDLILELAFGVIRVDARFVYWLGTVSAFLTAFYSIRLLYLTFLAQPNGSRAVFEKAHEGSWFMLGPLLVLAIGSLFFGFVFRDLMVGFGSTFYADCIYSNVTDPLAGEFIPPFIKLIPVIFSLSGAGLSYWLYTAHLGSLTEIKLTVVNKIYHFLSAKWFFDALYNKFFGLPIFKFGYNVTYLLFDKGLVELFGPKGVSANVYAVARVIRNSQSGVFYHYVSLFIIIVVMSLLFYIWSKF